MSEAMSIKELLEKFGIERCINKPEYIYGQMVCTMPMDDYNWLQAQIQALAALIAQEKENGD